MEKGCRELEECKGLSFSSGLIDGLQILMGGGWRSVLIRGRRTGFSSLFWSLLYFFCSRSSLLSL